MAGKKITVTIPEELVEAARELTDNLSGFAAEALADRIRSELLAEEMKHYQDEFGEFTDEEMAAADRLLDGRDRPSAGAA